LIIIWKLDVPCWLLAVDPLAIAVFPVLQHEHKKTAGPSRGGTTGTAFIGPAGEDRPEWGQIPTKNSTGKTTIRTNLPTSSLPQCIELHPVVQQEYQVITLLLLVSFTGRGCNLILFKHGTYTAVTTISDR